MVPPSSGQISRVCSYSGYCSLTLCFTYRTLTFFGWLSHVILLHFVILNAVQNPICIATNGLASSAFARHYSQNLVWFLFLRVLRCFSSPRSLHLTMYSSSDHWFFISVVSQFGNLRIEAYLQLPAAYRSLSRPSSAPDAKAFTLCSFLLELLFFSSPYCLSFANNFLQWKSYFNNFLLLGFSACVSTCGQIVVYHDFQKDL